MRGGDVKRRKRRQCKKGGEDRISQLPDDLLISILSRLTSKQATSTTILSTRWRSLYAYATRIDLPRPAPTKKRLPPIPTTTSTVDHVLDSHRGGRLKEFKVDASCESEEGANIGKWFESALAKGVEVIDIGLSENHSPLQQVVFSHNRGGCLRELSLSGIDVDDGELVLLLRSFPLLESLAIVSSRSLQNPSIVGPSTCKLKHLIISGAQSLESIEIDGLTNLVSLGCYGLRFKHSLSLSNVPKLVDFSTHDLCFYNVPTTFSRIPSIRDQIQNLKLYSCPSFTSGYDPLHMQFVGMRNLELRFPLSDRFECLYGLLPLIQACPSLEKLETKVNWSWSWSRSRSRKTRVRANEEKEKEINWQRLPKLKLSPNLKKVKLSGFVGSSSELELALSIMKNVVALEELVVEATDDKKMRALATHRARKHFAPIKLPYPFTLIVI